MASKKFVKSLTANKLLHLAKDILKTSREIDKESPSKGFWYANHYALLLDQALLALIAYSENKISLNKEEFESLFRYGICIKSSQERSRLTREFQKLNEIKRGK